MAATEQSASWDPVAEEKKWGAGTDRARQFQERFDQQAPGPLSGFLLLCVAELDAGSRLISSRCFASRDSFLAEIRRLIAEPTAPSRPVASMDAYRDAQMWWLESVITQYESNS
jgi:hypothetical protein